MSHHIIDFADVHFRYPDGTEALRGIRFRIIHGESVGIVGANGAGKSTLLQHLNGCLLPTQGAVTIGDLAVTTKTRKEICKKVGVVLQNPDDQLFMRRFLTMSPSARCYRPDEVRASGSGRRPRHGQRSFSGTAPHHLSARRALSRSPR